ncbi:Copia protein [Vitis vinifera]|uniref:Copia protein n=1 Tax=Vitis vinifera TaxID=29760 RepID=A0A438HYS3_VITVI|nr:Copia protein [Vitis vinifera]
MATWRKRFCRTNQKAFTRALSEFTLYIKKIEEDILIVSLYVDDLLVTGSNAGFVNKFKAEMEQAAKRVIRYVKGTVDMALSYCFSFGSGVFSWSSRKQEVVAQSTLRVEYIATVAAVNQALWLRKLLTDLDMKQEVSTKVFVDNQATISIVNDPVFHGKTKHFKIKLYFLREVQKEGDIQLVYCNAESQNADILTKALPKIRFEFLRERLGVCSS